jgi:hypothetical protein
VGATLSWILNWIVTSGLAAGVLLVAAWIARKWLLAQISESVRHEYDAKLENVRSELRARENQLAALRDGALTHMVSTQTAASQRRLKAVDDLWQAVTEWQRLAGAVKHMEVIKFEECSKSIESEPNLKEFFRMIQRNTPGFEGIGATAAGARPYLSDLAWALYTAYTTVFVVAAAQIKILSEGIDGRKFFDFAATDKVLITALPEYESFIKKFGHVGYGQLVDVLTSRILAELRNTVAGKEQDAESIRRASEILKASEQANRTLAEREIATPPGAAR